MIKKHVNEFPAVMGSFPIARVLMGERMKSRGTESSQSHRQSLGVKGVRFTCWKAGNEIQIQKNLLLFIRGFSVWSAESRQRSFKDSSKERWYNTGHRNKARRKQQFSHFAPHPAHNRQYLESFPRPRCSLCITELQSILSGKGATSFAVPAQQCCINYHFSSPPRYCISLCVTL